jgi:hypothetical protein
VTIEQWLEDAKQDAYRRRLPELATLLESLAQATTALRQADWNDDASGRQPAVNVPSKDSLEGRDRK